MSLTWIKIAESVAELSFKDNQLAEVDAGGKRVCVARQGDILYAVAARCPHASGEMAAGFIDAMGNIVCPVHRYRFALKNGRNVSGEGYYLKHWPVEVREDGVFIGFKETIFGLS